MIMRSASQGLLDAVTRILVACSSLVGLAVVLLAARAVFDARLAASLDAQTHEAQARARQLNVPHPPLAAGAVHAKGLDALRVLQDAVTKSAALNGCQLAEFRSATQTAPYTPRYQKELPDDPWAQMDAHFSAVGRLRDVMNTLRALKGSGVAVEVDAVNISRTSIKQDGTAVVTAQVDLRALTPGRSS